MDQQFYSVYYVHTCTCACASKWFMFTPRIYLYGKCLNKLKFDQLRSNILVLTVYAGNIYNLQ